jgi:hypothetical protein
MANKIKLVRDTITQMSNDPVVRKSDYNIESSSDIVEEKSTIVSIVPDTTRLDRNLSFTFMFLL